MLLEAGVKRVPFEEPIMRAKNNDNKIKRKSDNNEER